MRPTTLLFASCLAIAACANANPAPDGLWLGQMEGDDGEAIFIEVASDDLESAGFENVILHNLESGTLLLDTPRQQNETLVDGFYIQTSNQIGGQRLAHPIQLLKNQDGFWVGTAQPLGRQFSVWMDISSNSDGDLNAVIINPERNITGPARSYKLVPDDEGRYAFRAGEDGPSFTTAQFDPSRKTIRMNYGPLQDFEFQSVDEQSG
ncbi:MAG: hypothetical protein AAFP97_09950, partial [Pseudomonadota bacterium]